MNIQRPTSPGVNHIIVVWQHICGDWLANHVETLRLYIKNMIGHLSENTIASIFERLGLHPAFIPGGEVEIREDISTGKLRALQKLLRREQCEIMLDKRLILIERIRQVIIEMIHNSPKLPAINYSEYISKKLCINYTLLSKSFSKVLGITIEQFIIAQKIERVKKLLSQNDLTLSEIAWQLGYSSTAHLSTQFKRVTGTTPSAFKSRKGTIKKLMD